MTTIAQIRQFIASVPDGQPFGYAQLGLKPRQGQAATKALERLVAQGSLKSVTKGVFCKMSRGALVPKQPSDQALIEYLLYKNGQRVAYVTGLRLLSRWGFVEESVQHPWEIAQFKRRGIFRWAHLQIHAVASLVPVEEEIVYVLELLDVIKHFNVWAQQQPKQGMDRLKLLCDELTDHQKHQIIELGQYSSAGTCALIGALISLWGWEVDLSPLRVRVNPTSRYRCVASSTALPTGIDWGLSK